MCAKYNMTTSSHVRHWITPRPLSCQSILYWLCFSKVMHPLIRAYFSLWGEHTIPPSHTDLKANINQTLTLSCDHLIMWGGVPFRTVPVLALGCWASRRPVPCCCGSLPHPHHLQAPLLTSNSDRITKEKSLNTNSKWLVIFLILRHLYGWNGRHINLETR